MAAHAGARWWRATIVVLLLLHIVVIARIHPHYLAYFNELVGGPDRCYVHLSDSNVDWGQDLPAFSRWLGQHPDLADKGPLYFNYFGFDLPERWGVEAIPLPCMNNPGFSSDDPITCLAGNFCISATELVSPGLGRPWDEGREREYADLLAKLRELNRTTPFRHDDAKSLNLWTPFSRRLPTPSIGG